VTILIRSAQLFSDYLGKTNSDKSITRFDGRRCIDVLMHRLPLTLSYSRNYLGTQFFGGRRWPLHVQCRRKSFTFAISSSDEFLLIRVPCKLKSEWPKILSKDQSRRKNLTPARSDRAIPLGDLDCGRRLKPIMHPCMATQSALDLYGISIGSLGSAVFAGLTNVSDRQVRQRYSA